MLQMIQHQIDSASRSLIEKKKKRYVVGQLKYASKDEWNTFVYNQSGFKIDKRGNTNLLWLSKIGWMEIRLHKLIDGKIKQVIITKRAVVVEPTDGTSGSYACGNLRDRSRKKPIRMG